MRTCTHTRGRRVPEAAVHRFSSVFPQNRLFVDSMRTRRVFGDGGAESTTEERSRAPPTVPFVRSFVHSLTCLLGWLLALSSFFSLFFFSSFSHTYLARCLARSFDIVRSPDCTASYTTAGVSIAASPPLSPSSPRF